MNIFKEYSDDLGYPTPQSGDLTPWAKNGVLLLNAVLTVRGGIAASHRGIGWEKFTDRIIELLNQRDTPVVFLLWGRFAKDKAALITNPRHHILTAAHPSPLSASNGFFRLPAFFKNQCASRRAGGLEAGLNSPPPKKIRQAAKNGCTAKQKFCRTAIFD